LHVLIGRNTWKDDMRKVTAFEELETELQDDAEYRKAQRRRRPYYDIALDIVKRRVNLGLTQKELAEKANTYQTRISKIEASEIDVRLSTLISIAEALESQLSIKMVPSSEVFYESDNFYQDLFKTNAIPQSKAANITPKIRTYSINVEVKGSSRS
jgi:transcriptional regulator with XRE-family HTH domain